MRHQLTHGKRRDWFQILRALARAGVSMAEVGRKCGRSKYAVKAWADGGDPKEAEARIVLTLFAEKCPAEYLAHQRQYEIRVANELQLVGTFQGVAVFGRPFMG